MHQLLRGLQISTTQQSRIRHQALCTHTTYNGFVYRVSDHFMRTAFRRLKSDCPLSGSGPDPSVLTNNSILPCFNKGEFTDIVGQRLFSTILDSSPYLCKPASISLCSYCFGSPEKGNKPNQQPIRPFNSIRIYQFLPRLFLAQRIRQKTRIVDTEHYPPPRRHPPIP
ncbi:hypothetical protein TMatcc_007447 [Talaromyces marneffei ATCC 18224]